MPRASLKKCARGPLQATTIPVAGNACKIVCIGRLHNSKPSISKYDTSLTNKTDADTMNQSQDCGPDEKNGQGVSVSRVGWAEYSPNRLVVGGGVSISRIGGSV